MRILRVLATGWVFLGLEVLGLAVYSLGIGDMAMLQRAQGAALDLGWAALAIALCAGYVLKQRAWRDRR